MEQFLVQNALYVVLLVTLITWGGIGIYLNRLENRLNDMEKKFNKNS